ncbi:MAG: ribonuclease III [Gammaproteobacteria bacterium]|nr:ribonuclease III [Gammaproteobacteria bacterium]
MLDKAETWLKKTLDYQFDDVRLLQQALTHRSASGDNNERLEFLGDAVLDFLISDFLFRSHANAQEGDLSRLRSSLVKGTLLAELASDLGIGEHLILGSGERKTGGHRRESILADALEALFGAVYLDAGIEAARKIVERALADRLHDLTADVDLRDPKTRLQEWLQARGLGLPEYELVKVSGKAHQQQFDVTCTVNNGAAQTDGSGTTRRNAEQESAQKMLKELAGTDIS